MESFIRYVPYKIQSMTVKDGIDKFLDTAFLDEIQVEKRETIQDALKDIKWKEAALT